MTNLTLDQIGQLKATTAKEITAILNSFSAQTGLEIENVGIETLQCLGKASSYLVHLDVRL